MALYDHFTARAETLAGLVTALASAKAVAQQMLKDGVCPVIEVRQQSKKRTDAQNRLQRKWMKEASEQGDMTAEEYRGYCKAYFGIPILLHEDDEFREQYNRVIKPLDYETKMQLMMEPFDFPVTRLMNSDQKTRYLSRMYEHFTGLGFQLTDPGEKLRKAA